VLRPAGKENGDRAASGDPERLSRPRIRFFANAEDSPNGAVISIEGVVGKIPFSAESPEARASLRQVLSRRPSSEVVWLERAGRNRVVLRGEAPLGQNPNRAGVVAALSAMLSAGKPLLDILADCGACAPVTAVEAENADAAGAN
jgi:hypothetical protein